MTIDQQVRQLAQVNGNGGHFLSLYIDTKRNDEAQKDRIRLFLKHESQRIRAEIGGNGHGEMIERGIKQIEEYISNGLDNSTRGLALFSCPSENFFLPIQLPVPVDPQLAIGARPELRQLFRLRQEHPQVLIALVDAKTARLCRMSFHELVQAVDLESADVPRKHDQGGWSQANIQRHVQDHIDRHHKDVAEVLNKMAEGGAVKGVILSGQERNIANFREYLNKHASERVIGSLHLDMRASDAEIIEAAQPIVQQQLADQQGMRLDALQEATKSTGRGAVGAAKVADAVNQRRLLELFLTRDARLQGWKCAGCGIIGDAVPLTCPACSGQVMTIDLVEEFIAAATNENADVHFVDSFPLLDRHEGVGATFRF
jgi:peptide subunit release factor 1 (eRF1)